MLIIRLAALSCALYLGFVVVAELAFFAGVLWKRDFGMFFNSWAWVAFSTLAWTISTSLAFRIVSRAIRAKLRS